MLKMLIALITVILAINIATAQSTTPRTHPTESKTTTPSNNVPSGMLVLNVPDIVEKLDKSVVNVQAIGAEGTSLGTGFFVDQSGLAVTNFHVIREALKNPPVSEITIVTSEGDRYEASVKGYDESTDLALLEIKKRDKELQAVRLGDSDKVRVGEWAIAVGNPYGLEHTVTLGIISAKGRTGLDGEYDDYLQTDAAINVGNSGGPLVNVKGEVIGINTLVLAKGQGLGFSIPVNILRDVLPQLRDQGRVRRSALDMETEELNIRLIKELRLPEGIHGILVSKVERETTAARAGLRRYDIIIAVNDVNITTTGQFNRLISHLLPGSKVEIKIRREDKEFVIKAELVEKK